jgi:hypothetical protein
MRIYFAAPLFVDAVTAPIELVASRVLDALAKLGA